MLADLGVSRDELEKVKTAEVGNIFNFGTAKCQQLGLTITDERGEMIPVHLGSYGIGITRLMGTIVELFHDADGIMWPESVAPFQLHLISLLQDSTDHAEELYKRLVDAGVDVLYDDRDIRPGEKFKDADLIGIPHRVVVSEKTVETEKLEYSHRTATREKSMISFEQLTQRIQ